MARWQTAVLYQISRAQSSTPTATASVTIDPTFGDLPAFDRFMGDAHAGGSN